MQILSKQGWWGQLDVILFYDLDCVLYYLDCVVLIIVLSYKCQVWYIQGDNQYLTVYRHLGTCSGAGATITASHFTCIKKQAANEL